MGRPTRYVYRGMYHKVITKERPVRIRTVHIAIACERIGVAMLPLYIPELHDTTKVRIDVAFRVEAFDTLEEAQACGRDYIKAADLLLAFDAPCRGRPELALGVVRGEVDTGLRRADYIEPMSAGVAAGALADALADGRVWGVRLADAEALPLVPFGQCTLF